MKSAYGEGGEETREFRAAARRFVDRWDCKRDDVVLGWM